MTEITVANAPFNSRPCVCVKNHSPVPVAVELHHVYPQEFQIDRWGEVRVKELVPLCDTAHKNIHEAIRHWRKGQPFTLGNHYQQSIAIRGFHYIKEGEEV